MNFYRCLAALLFALPMLHASESFAAKKQIIDLQGKTIQNSNGPCLTYNGISDVLIRNGTIGPCGGDGIQLKNAQRVVFKRMTIKNVGNNGIVIDDSLSVRIEESLISGTKTGVNARNSKRIKVTCNTIIDSRGPMPMGQHIQFNTVNSGGNVLACNVGRNSAGSTNPEDAISMYRSSGNSNSPIDIANNLIVGGGPSTSGGGIMLGDVSGSYITARKNVLVDPGQYGIAVSGGHTMRVQSNWVYARQQWFTNVGVYVWNQYSAGCAGVIVQNNSVNWTNKSGQTNPYWNGGGCGEISGVSTNVFYSSIDSSIEKRGAPDCTCKKNGRGT